jgi:hypothetical protein
LDVSGADASSCAAFRGKCDSAALSPRQKAALLLHCPATCAGTIYADGGGAGYCPCTAGRDCCFDEPHDCASRVNASNTVVSHVMCRRSVGLCGAPAPQAEQRGRRAADSSCTQGSAYPILLKELGDALAEQAVRTEAALTAASAAADSRVLDPVAMLQAARALS